MKLDAFYVHLLSSITTLVVAAHASALLSDCILTRNLSFEDWLRQPMTTYQAATVLLWIFSTSLEILVRHTMGTQCKGGVVFCILCTINILACLLTGEDIIIFLYNLAIVEIAHYPRTASFINHVAHSPAWKSGSIYAPLETLRSVARASSNTIELDFDLPFLEPITYLLWTFFTFPFTAVRLSYEFIAKLVTTTPSVLATSQSPTSCESSPDSSTRVLCKEPAVSTPIEHAKFSDGSHVPSELETGYASTSSHTPGTSGYVPSAPSRERIKAAVAKAVRRQNASLLRKQQEGFTSASDSDGFGLRPTRTKFKYTAQTWETVIALTISRIMLLYFYAHVTFKHAQMPLTSLVAATGLLFIFLVLVERLSMGTISKYLSIFHLDVVRSCAYTPVTDGSHSEHAD